MRIAQRAILPLAVTAASLLATAAVSLAQSANPGGTSVLSAAQSEATPSEPVAAPETTPGATARPLTPTRITALPHPAISDGTAPLRVRLSGEPAADSPRPMITPRVAGSWSTRGTSEYFTPTSTLEPCSSYQLTVWAATSAVGHSPVGQRRTITLQVACPSIRALQQTLARLGYLPYEFRSRYGIHLAGHAISRASAARHLYRLPNGKLHARYGHVPPLSEGNLDATTRGALTVYQGDHGLPVTAAADQRTWASLLAADTSYSRDRRPYTYVTVSERIPETLEVHRGGHVTFSTPVNTGVAGAETQTGVFAIYSRFVSTTMVGTNPDGSRYNDPGVPWVNYFNGGDAVHGFPRPSYGTPQSNGCVELPIESARRVYGMLRIGDIVQIER